MAGTDKTAPWLQQQETAGAIVLASDERPEGDVSDSSQDEGSDTEDDELEKDYPPGPICPDQCTLGGPGYTGGAAKSTLSFFVTAKDERGTRIREGGAYVAATIRPGNSARAAGADTVTATVKDNNDGTYTASYSVAARGDYELSVEVNGSPIGGSPFPVFFSPPEPAAAEQPPAASAAADHTPSLVDSAIAASSALDAALMSTANAALATAPPSVLGPQAHEAGVEFPAEAEVLDRTLLVGNLNPIVTVDQIRQLFAFCGSVTEVSLVGNNKQFALVQYATPGEAAAASAMNNMQVVDRAIAVEQAAIAAKSKEKGTANPYAAIKAAHLQQVMIAQMQQAQLAAQVAAMRVQAKTNPGAVVAPGAPQNSASQKAAALSAIAALSKRLAGGGAAAPSFPSKAPPRSVSPSNRAKRRREVSPTIRKRPSPPPRRRSPSPPRRRRDASRDRRDGDRDRSRSRRRDRDEDARRERRDRDRGDRDRRDRERRNRDDRDDRREKDRERDRRGDRVRADRDEAGRRDRRDRSARDGESRRDREDRNGGGDDPKGAVEREHGDRRRAGEEEAGRENGSAARAADKAREDAKEQRRAEEARRLRERALEALNASSKTAAAPAEEPLAPAAQQDAAPVANGEPIADEPGRERKRSRSPSLAAGYDRTEDDREEQRRDKHHKKHKKHKKQHRHRDRDREENAPADDSVRDPDSK